MEVQYIHRVKGEGLIATKFYKQNKIVRVLEGNINDKPNKYSIEIGKNKHIIDKYGIYINHSFEPNTKIEDGKVIAIKDININDEITFNYNHSETNMCSPFYSDGKYIGDNN